MSRTDLDLDLLRRVVDALKPFTQSFEDSRQAHARRYADRELGFKNFDKMPGHWPMDRIKFTMGEFRAAVDAHRAMIARLDEPQDREAGVTGPAWQPFEVDLIPAKPPEYEPVELDTPAPQAVDAETAGLVNRLRGRYAMGPHLPNGEPEFGWRQFEATPINLEAADMIEALSAQRTAAEAARDEAVRALKRLRLNYVSLLETGRDRILDLGGTCDPVDVMEANDPRLRAVDAFLAALKAGEPSHD